MATPPGPTDLATLLARAGDGDAGAFRALAGQLWGPALRLATRVTGDRGDAEDAVQSALAKIWSGRARFDPDRGAAAAWFRRIVVNQCLDSRRRLRPVRPLEDAAAVASTAPDPFEAAADARARRALDAAMAALNPRQRAAIALFHGDGASMAQIAEALGSTPKAVEGLLGRARIELRRMLATEYGAE